MIQTLINTNTKKNKKSPLRKSGPQLTFFFLLAVGFIRFLLIKVVSWVHLPFFELILLLQEPFGRQVFGGQAAVLFFLQLVEILLGVASGLDCRPSRNGFRNCNPISWPNFCKTLQKQSVLCFSPSSRSKTLFIFSLVVPLAN